MSAEVLIEQPTMRPTRKVGRGALAGFIAWALLKLLTKYVSPELPPLASEAMLYVGDQLAGLVTVGAGFLCAYMTKDRAPTEVVVPIVPAVPVVPVVQPVDPVTPMPEE